jgi:ubiquinone biosynthesis protein
MWDGLIAVRDVSRIYELASILVRYGAGDLLRRLGLVRALARLGKVLPMAQVEAAVALPAPERMRRALEEMGATFVKLGQLLATRVDLLGPEWTTELGKLQNRVPGVPYEQIHAQIVEDLGAEPEAVFAWFDRTPLAAASIAQVHRAQLHDGTQVVVKIRRPGLRPVVDADLRLLRLVAQAIEAHAPELRVFQPVGMARQFTESLTREMDLAAECRHAERIASGLDPADGVVVPRVYWEYTGERLNVQQYLDGIGITDLAALQAAGIEGRDLAARGANAILGMMLQEGFFHADPHPGNVFALPGGRIGLIDYGMVGRLTRRRRQEVVEMLYGLVQRDPARVTAQLLGWAEGEAADEDALTRDIDAFIDRYHGVPLGQLDLAGMLLEVMAILRSHRLSLPADLALMIKVCLTLEGMGRSLDPDFDMAGQAAPFLSRAMAARYAPRALLREGVSALAETASVASSLPGALRRLLQQLRSGKAVMRIELNQLDSFGAQINHSANRLTVGVVLAALVIGSSITMTVSGGPKLFGLPAFGFMGFIGATLAGIWLVLSIWRTGGGK